MDAGKQYRLCPIESVLGKDFVVTTYGATALLHKDVKNKKVMEPTYGPVERCAPTSSVIPTVASNQLSYDHLSHSPLLSSPHFIPHFLNHTCHHQNTHSACHFRSPHSVNTALLHLHDHDHDHDHVHDHDQSTPLQLTLVIFELSVFCFSP